jgi:hypothetical protein
MLRRGLTLLFIYVCVGLVACDPFEKDGPIPAYIRIEKFTVQTKSDNSQGSGAHAIEDAWLYVENELIGVFEVPVTVPVIAIGKKRITIFGGIRKNGLANTRIPYPFYTTYNDTLDLVLTEIDTIRPVVKYYDALKFPWLEDFEDNSISFSKSGTDVTVDSMYITKDQSLVFDYDGVSNLASGAVDIPLGSQIFQNASIESYDLPRSDDVYLELNYKTDVALQTGLIATKTTTAIPLLLLFPTDGEWKKAYISLAEDLNDPKYSGSEFKIFLDAVSNSDTSINQIFIDNVKIIHR